MPGLRSSSLGTIQQAAAAATARRVAREKAMVMRVRRREAAWRMAELKK